MEKGSFHVIKVIWVGYYLIKSPISTKKKGGGNWIQRGIQQRNCKDTKGKKLCNDQDKAIVYRETNLECQDDWQLLGVSSILEARKTPSLESM